MKVYRCVNLEELNNIRLGRIQIKKYGEGSNTFTYQNNEERVHFFLFPEAAEHYKKKKYERNSNSWIIIQCDIPKELLILCYGYGYYESIIPGYYAPLPEFSIPICQYNPCFLVDFCSNIKEEWCIDGAFDKYLASIPRKMLADFETGAFEKGYNERSVLVLNLEEILISSNILEKTK